MKSFPQFSRVFATVLVASGLAFINADTLPAQTPKADAATHAAHVASGTHPATSDAAKSDPALNEQLSQLQSKIAQLETALAKNVPQQTTAVGRSGMGGPLSGAGPAMAGMGGPPSGAEPAMAGMGGPPSGAGPAMAGMGGPPSGAGPAMAGMGGPPMGMMAMMDKMMGMMDKMMGMGGGGAMPAGAPAAGMRMGMEKMEMAGMMGMGALKGASPEAMTQSALPGFPGASHLYHIGATGFFLDHQQHIALTTEQQAGLNQAKQQALLAKSTADRAIQQAEQELWTLTASDQPEAAKIEGKIAEIAKLTGDERLVFIRAVGDASKLLTDDQRKSLTGFAPPASAAPAAAPMAGMKGM